jgi:hypothetical protein
MDKETFIAAYIEAAYYADTPEDAPAGAMFDAESLADIRQTSGDFYDTNQSDIRKYCEMGGQAGHDLWFTQQGHGCGYWEHDDAVSVRLYEAVKSQGVLERYIGVTDGGSLYID